MIEKLKNHISDLKKFNSQDLNEIESLKIKFLGRKGIINDLFSGFKDVPPDQKKEFGQKINELKILAQKKYDDLKSNIKISSKHLQKILQNQDFQLLQELFIQLL
jgi:phenylalanyl-tRNA synthetase alpha chain